MRSRGGSTGDQSGNLVWNPVTGTFDVAPSSSTSGSGTSGDGQNMGVMMVVAREGHFADVEDVEEAGEEDLVFDPASGEFRRRTTDATTPVAQPVPAVVSPDAPSEPPGQSAGVMQLIARDGHFSPDLGRLAAEFKVLGENFNRGDAKLCKMTPEAVHIIYKQRYGLTLVLPDGYPNVMPSIFVSHPNPCRKKDGSVFDSVSAEDHTLKFDERYGTQICHSSPRCWKPNNALAQVIFKAFMWLDAYEKHLVTGKNIDDYLRHQRQ